MSGAVLHIRNTCTAYLKVHVGTADRMLRKLAHIPPPWRQVTLYQHVRAQAHWVGSPGTDWAHARRDHDDLEPHDDSKPDGARRAVFARLFLPGHSRLSRFQTLESSLMAIGQSERQDTSNGPRVVLRCSQCFALPKAVCPRPRQSCSRQSGVTESAAAGLLHRLCH